MAAGRRDSRVDTLCRSGAAGHGVGPVLVRGSAALPVALPAGQHAGPRADAQLRHQRLALRRARGGLGLDDAGHARAADGAHPVPRQPVRRHVLSLGAPVRPRAQRRRE